jgi:mono/diheme cytochrome c family protein
MGSPLAIQIVEWNAKKADVGKIAAVAEIYDDTLVLSDTGATIFTSGVPLASDGGVKGWRKAAVLPAADLSGEWAIGVDQDGILRRLRNRSLMEGISERYALGDVKVLDLVAVERDKGWSAFSLESGQIAVADGDKVTRYDGAYEKLQGGFGRVAGLVGGALRVFTPKSGGARDYTLPGVTALVLDASGKLLIAVGTELYREQEDGNLRRVHVGQAPITQMVLSGPDVWMLQGDSLMLLQGGRLRRGPPGLVQPGTQLIGSPSGALWLLRDGALSMLDTADGGGADRSLWRRTVLPIFTRLCAVCHLPGGSAGIDMSTYETWASRKESIDVRVLQGKPTPMPPAGGGTLTPEERAALRTWLDNQQK